MTLDGRRGLRRVLLLGGTSEIGLATVRALGLSAGSEVILAGRDLAALEAAGRKLPGITTRTIWFDASHPESVPAAVRQAFADADIHLVIPAFGVLGDQVRSEKEPATAIDQFTVNVTSQAVALLESLRLMRAQRHGTIVVLSSIAGVRSRRANFVYGSTKAAIEALSEGLRLAARGTGVRVVVVRPGFVVGRMTKGLPPAPFARTPAVVGAAIAEAIRTNQREVWVPGWLSLVAWVMRRTPDVLWRRVRR